MALGQTRKNSNTDPRKPRKFKQVGGSSSVKMMIVRFVDAMSKMNIKV